MKKISEGKAIFFADVSDIVSRKLEVFYNPVMKFNRDVSIHLLNSRWLKNRRLAGKKRKLRVGLPLAGTGIRGIRLFLEVKKSVIDSIHFNDLDTTAVKTIQKNLKMNNINRGRYTISNLDSNQFLLSESGFDYIDVDPFGSPNQFIDSCIKRLSRNGILAVTATDTGCLAGSYAKAGLRKYWSKSLKTEHMHELGLRILIRKIQLVGMQYDKALVPIFSYFRDHYFRIFFVNNKGRDNCDDLAKLFGYYLHCSKCSGFDTSKNIFNSARCKCGGNIEYAGPLWLGNLFDRNLTGEILAHDKENRFLEIIFEESKLEFPFFYDLHKLCKIYKVPELPKTEFTHHLLRKKGYLVSQTHFTSKGIKTNAKVNLLVRILSAQKK